MQTSRTDSARFVDDYLPALLAQASRLISGEFHLVVNANGFTVSEWRVLEPFGLQRADELKSTLRSIIELHGAPVLDT